MKIAVLSGKGGTGKTFVSVNLSSVAKKCVYIDCDVEEPNGHLFFKPQNIKCEDVNILLPKFDEKKCNGCKKCIEFCKFNALAFYNNSPHVFDEVCHSCGGCEIICPNNAISEYESCIGKINTGVHNDTTVLTGILNVGKVSGVPIIKKLLGKFGANNDTVIIDCPPGSACSVTESVKNCDYCIIVAEPTLFGAHNFSMVYELVKLLKKPFGVVINKDEGDDNPTIDFCKKNNIPVLLKIPYDKNIAKTTSNGLIASEIDNKFKKMFLSLLKKVESEVKK